MAMQLVLHPAAVHTERAVAGDTRPIVELLPALRSGGVLAVTETGVLGDPTTATVGSGRAMLAALTDDLLAHVASWLAS
jgi:creatinine amidohydrolase